MFSTFDIKENEIIIFSCSKCKISKNYNAKKFFSEIPSLRLLPTLKCSQCDNIIAVSLKEE